MRLRNLHFTALILSSLCAPLTRAHEGTDGHSHEAAPLALPFITEKKGPIRAPKAIRLEPGTKTTGQGFWTFVAAPELVPVPPAAEPFVKGAHGTVIYDEPRDIVYWGLKGVGFIGFSNQLSQSWIVPNPTFARGNIHGADLIQRSGQTPLIIAADNEQGQVHLTDTTFQNVASLGIPPLAPYADGKGYAPTDATFVGLDQIWVTDGYGKAFFMPATVSPLQFTGESYGGKAMSGTPHGITYDPRTKSLLISARPEGRVLQWGLKDKKLAAIDGLPPGSTVCDVDVWGDYALAPCLNDTDKTKAGPIFIINLKKRAVVATLRPKDDLTYRTAQSIHDACWYVTGKGRQKEVYVVFTAWNPGGIGALKLVNIAP